MPNGLKRADIRPCDHCGSPLFGPGSIACYAVTIVQQVADPGAIQRAAGLEAMLGGNARIAAAMGPDEDLTHALGEPASLLICLECAMKAPPAALLEAASERKEPV